MKIQRKGQYYTVGRYKLDNYQDAVSLQKDLNELESLQKNSTIDTSKLEKQIIQLKLTVNILNDEINRLEDMIQ